MQWMLRGVVCIVQNKIQSSHNVRSGMSVHNHLSLVHIFCFLCPMGRDLPSSQPPQVLPSSATALTAGEALPRAFACP